MYSMTLKFNRGLKLTSRVKVSCKPPYIRIDIGNRLLKSHAYIVIALFGDIPKTMDSICNLIMENHTKLLSCNLYYLKEFFETNGFKIHFLNGDREGSDARTQSR